MAAIDQYILSITIFLPLLTAFGVAASRQLNIAKWIAFAGSLLTMLATFHIWYYFDANLAGLQFTEVYDWLPEYGMSYLVGVDGINLLLVVLTGFLTPLVVISSWHSDSNNQKAFLALIMALECGMLGALVSFDLVFFYIFWEVMLIPMYFLIGIWGGANRIYATTKFVIYTVFGSLLMLVAAIALYIYHYKVFGEYSTNLLSLYKLNEHSAIPQNILFAAFALAFAIKVPIWPFHTWLPHAHTEAPTAGSVILAGVLLKMGTYGFIRFAIPLFPQAVQFFAPALLSLGVAGIIYGALVAWVQHDAKKLVAYSSVSHLGFVVIGSLAFLSSGALSEEALTGAIYQMINHGISTGALFFLVGVIYERRHTRELEAFGGLAKSMPWFSVMLIIATLGSVGLPGTGGFVGEFLILLGSFEANKAVGFLASLGVLLGAIYMLKLCRKVLFGPIVHRENADLGDLTVREWLYLAPLAVLVIAMGIYPNLFLDKTRESIKYFASHYKTYRLIISEKDQNLSKQKGPLAAQMLKN